MGGPRMQRNGVTGHLGVRLPASPPPRALDEGTLRHRGLINVHVHADGVRKMPQHAAKTEKLSEKPHASVK